MPQEEKGPKSPAGKRKAATNAIPGPSVDEAKTIISELCALFYDQGWVGGTGGGISVKCPSDGSIVMAPSGVQKERMQPDDMFVLDGQGEVIFTPAAKPPPAREPKLSECSPLFMAVSAHACRVHKCPFTDVAVLTEVRRRAVGMFMQYMHQ